MITYIDFDYINRMVTMTSKHSNKSYPLRTLLTQYNVLFEPKHKSFLLYFDHYKKTCTALSIYMWSFFQQYQEHLRIGLFSSYLQSILGLHANSLDANPFLRTYPSRMYCNVINRFKIIFILFCVLVCAPLSPIVGNEFLSDHPFKFDCFSL